MDGHDLERFHSGDDSFFSGLVAQYSAQLERNVRNYARDRDDIDDLMQATWVAVHRCRRKFHGNGSLRGWIMKVCRSTCIDHCRLRDRRDSAKAAVARGLPLADGYVGASESATDGDSERIRLVAVCKRQLKHLPPRQHDILVDRLLLGRPTAETADRLGCASGTVKATLHQALRSLRQSLTTSRDGSLHLVRTLGDSMTAEELSDYEEDSSWVVQELNKFLAGFDKRAGFDKKERGSSPDRVGG